MVLPSSAVVVSIGQEEQSVESNSDWYLPRGHGWQPVENPICFALPKEPIPQEGWDVGRDEGLLLDGKVEDGALLGYDEDGELLG